MQRRGSATTLDLPSEVRQRQAELLGLRTALTTLRTHSATTHLAGRHPDANQPVCGISGAPLEELAELCGLATRMTMLERAEQESEAMNADLECRVAGRTAQLEAEIAERRRIEEQWRRSEEVARGQLAEIHAYYDTAPVGLFVLDTQLRFRRINQRLAQINGQPVAAHLGRTVREVLPDLADSIEPLFHRVITTGEPLLDLEICEPTTTRPGGQRIWQADYYPLRSAAGDIIGINGFAEDITERQQIALNLRDSERRFRELFEHLPIAYQSLDGEGRWLDANQAMADLLGFATPAQLLGRSFRDYRADPTGDQPTTCLATVSATDTAGSELRLRRRDGSVVTVILTQRTQRDAGGHFVRTHCVMTDISARRTMEGEILELNANLERKVEERTVEVRASNAALRESEERFRNLAFTDPLTGLPNRVLGQDRLLQAVRMAARHQTSMAVLYLDLDKFKYVNESHGHVVGDLLLKAVAARLTRHLGPAGTLCRLSADEFMMVLPQLAPDQAVTHVVGICEAVLADVAMPFDLEGRQLFTSFSLGVAIYPQDGSDGETLMRNADTALFQAKKAGHHNYRFFAPQMNADLIGFVQTCDALRGALEREEFELYYQPQIDLRSNRVLGVEALIRWHRPVAGLTLPAHFIAAAEESGLIVPIGRWVLRQACRQAAAWRDLGWHDFVVAVNLSAVQFRQGQVEQDVMDALEDSGLNPAYLELELTESILIDNTEAVIAAVARWQARGIRLSIDDFGTGYSSLAYLKRLKVDKLKIDRSFITDLQTDEQDCAIVQAIIQMARSMNLGTIAEGVEDTALADQLRFIGCQEAQGYLYSKPLPAQDLEQWLKGFAERYRHLFDARGSEVA